MLFTTKKFTMLVGYGLELTTKSCSSEFEFLTGTISCQIINVKGDPQLCSLLSRYESQCQILMVRLRVFLLESRNFNAK